MLHVTQITPATKWVFVQLRDGEDGVGIGEATLSGHEESLERAMDDKANAALAAIGESPSTFAEYQAPRNLAEAAILGAVDQALWDLHARRRNQAVVDALGGARRDAIPVYANINRRTRVRTPESFATSARDALAAGFDAIKLAPFDNVEPGRAPVANREALSHGLDSVRAVRDAIGDERRLMVDCHWRFDEDTAARLIEHAEPLGVHWIECPLPETRENIDAIVRLRTLANDVGIRLAGLEQTVRLESFRPWCEAGAYDVMMPDVKYAGGLAEMLRIGAALADYGIEVSPHNPSGPVSHAASLHVCSALKQCDMLEMQFDESPLFDALCSHGIPPVNDGAAHVPPGPGLGVSLDRMLVDEHAAAPVRIWQWP